MNNKNFGFKFNRTLSNVDGMKHSGNSHMKSSIDPAIKEIT
jgi:hypothetical protein